MRRNVLQVHSRKGGGNKIRARENEQNKKKKDGKKAGNKNCAKSEKRHQ